MARTSLRPAWVDDRLFPFASRFLDLDGHRVHYVDEGRGPVLLFLAGGPAWSFMYRHHIAALRGRFRCIALDYPGYGLSQAGPRLDNTVAGMSRVVERFVEQLDLRDVTLWVNDLGGIIGLGAAGRDPDRYRAFVLAGTFGFSLESYPGIERMLQRVSSPGFRWLNRHTNLLAKLMGGPALGARKLSKEEARHYTQPYDEDRAARDRVLFLMGSYAAQRDYAREVERNLARLRAKPALIVFGARDASTKAGAYARFQQEFPIHEAVLLPRVRHFTPEDAPAELLRAFEAWWPSIAKRPALNAP